MDMTRRNLFGLAAGLGGAGLLVAKARAKGAPGRSQHGADIDAIVREELDRRRIPGLTLAIARGAEPIHVQAYGRSDLELNQPMTIDSVFQSASTGKMFTAVAILLLAREGRLAIDDPLARHLGDVPPAWSKITLRHMMSHRSGIADIAPGLLDAHGRPLDPALEYDDADLLGAFATWPLDFPPGSRFRYSNTAFVVLGMVVKAVSGQFYGEYLRARVFGPAGMPTAQVNDIYAVVPHRVRGFLLASDGALIRPYIASRSISRIADGTLLFGARDWLAWAAALEANTVLSPAELTECWRAGNFPDGSAPVISYGLGWFLLNVRGRRLVCHHGIWQGFSAWIGHYPDDDLTIAMLCNLESGHPGQFAARIAGVVDPVLGPLNALAETGPDASLRHAALRAWLTGDLIGDASSGEVAHQRRACEDFGALGVAAPELVSATSDRYLYRVRNAEQVGLVEITRRGGRIARVRMPQAWPVALYEMGAAVDTPRPGSN